MAEPPKIDGVLETCLYVDDMAVAHAFYRRVFGFEAIIADERIVVLDVGPRQVLILFTRGGTLEPIPVAGSSIPPHDGSGPQHFAFAIGAEAYDDWRRHLNAVDVAIESEVVWPQGGRSLYFRDPDGHLGELATPGVWPNYAR